MSERELGHALDTFEMEAQTSILSNVGLYSHGTALLAYIMLAILAFISRRNSPVGVSLLYATLLTALWAGTVTLSNLLPEPLLRSMQVAEVARNAAWAFVLLRLVGTRYEGTDHIIATNRWIPWYAITVVVLVTVLLGIGPLAERTTQVYDISSYVTFGLWLVMAIGCLLALEQYFRNSKESELWSTKHMCIALGIIFAFDVFMYAQALLYRNLDRELWQARGIVVAMAALLIAISVSRAERRDPGRDSPRSVHLSRHVAFHSLTLMASGIYLITMALAAYFIRYLGGNWSGVLQIVFLTAAGLILVVLLFSGRIRSSVRVWLSKNFFSYKYDYRMEWLQFTRLLAESERDVPTGITRAVANLAKSPAGLLWSRAEDGRFGLVAHWEMPHPGNDIDLGTLPAWLERREWIIDVREWRRSPDVYQNLELPTAVLDINRAWLIIPLLSGQKLQGILLLREPDIIADLNWEDRDLLKVAGRQAASHLAQFQADQALVESRQFEAFNRLSAYVIHDLKNILAQLSLTVSNAEKHKENPAFIDDMVATVDNAVQRMTSLMAQLRNDEGAVGQQQFELSSLLKEAVSDSQVREPCPDLTCSQSGFTLNCDRERLLAVFGHLINNAQDATDNNGRVEVRLKENDGSALIEIEDTGIGMDEDFIRQRLFKPFDSTKGLTGMGIGAFESRDFIR
ncbi:MAG: PEP-CTERM system histidine kinase PrsK, partial [Halioglobus sp.]|nr:PEP-CTERM system histidine kinase PrsK [Halioglobus sp.]